MAGAAMHLTDETVGELAHRVADALGEQAELHVELVKAEFARDTRAFGSDLVPLLAGIPLIGLGYALVCVAIAEALSQFIGSFAGFALVGTLNLTAGAVAVRLSLSRLGTRRLFDATIGPELERSVRGVVSALRNPPARVDTSNVR